MERQRSARSSPTRKPVAAMSPIIVQCGQYYNGNNNSCTTAFEGYWGNGIDAPGYNSSEVVHKLTLANATNLVVTLGGLTANLDLVVLSACNNYNAIAISANGGTSNEQITLNNLAAGMYWIVVDAKNNATGSYNLAVNCNYTCAAPTLAQIDATYITCNAAMLTANVPCATSYDWRYRAVGANNWIELNATTAANTPISM